MIVRGAQCRPGDPRAFELFGERMADFSHWRFDWAWTDADRVQSSVDDGVDDEETERGRVRSVERLDAA